MEAGDLDRGCPKLEESQRLFPGGGTLLNVALCHEKQGKIASAWSEFVEARALARRDHRQDREAFADERITALEPTLPRITIELASGADIEGLSIQRNGKVIPKAAWSIVQPVDPGTHRFVVSALGRKTAEVVVAIERGGSKTVKIPKLDNAPAPAVSSVNSPAAAPTTTASATSSTPARSAPRRDDTRWIAGTTLVSVGALGIATGAVFGVHTVALHHQSTSLCPTANTCTSEGARQERLAHTSATISNVAFAIGAVAEGAGIYLLLTRPAASVGAAPSPRSIAVHPAIAPGLTSLSIDARW
jgi:hypothetical protein